MAGKYLYISVLLHCSYFWTDADQFLKIGVLSPHNSELGYCTNGSLFQAIEHIKKNVKIDGYTLNSSSLFIADSECKGSSAVGKYARMRVNDSINVVLGVPCSAAARSTAELSAGWKRPVLSWYAPDVKLMNKDMYPTLVRTFPPIHKTVKPVMKLLDLYKWRNIGVLIGEEDADFNLWALLRDEIEQRDNINLLHKVTCATQTVSTCLQELKTSARIILLMIPTNQLTQYMNEAKLLGYDNSYVFMHYYWMAGLNSAEELWKGPSDGTWGNLLLMSIKLPAMNNYMKFVQQSIEASEKHAADNGIENKCTNSSSALSLLLSGYMFDTLVYYARAKKHVEDASKEWSDFRSWTGELNSNSLQPDGQTGDLRFDERGDREAEYSIKHYQNGHWQEIVTIDSDNGQSYKQHQRLIWPEHDTLPSDTPSCGFDGKVCSDRNYAIISVTIVLVVAGAAVGGYFYYKRFRLEKEIFKKSWVVDRSDVIPVKQQTDRHLQAADKSAGHSTTPRKRLKRMATRFSNNVGFGSTWSFDHSPEIHADIARYKTDIVVLKRKRRQFKLDRETLQDLQALYTMKEIHINSFIGATINSDPVVLMGYCEKGSLWDVLENSDIKLDSMFVLSFLSDIVRGMHYLHNSTIGSHGNLKSTNCVIDSRWVVKLTDLGVVCYGGSIHGSDGGGMSEEEYYRGLLWTAPELLRLHRVPPKGTQEGDIYSFAIIIQEMITRSKPYFHNVGFSGNNYKDIIEMVQGGSSNGHLCRPLVFKDAQDTYANCEVWPSKFPKLEELMRMCWSEDPDLRFSFVVIKQKLKMINDGRKTLLVDHMIKLMEKYTNNLEELVVDRTEELEQEKQKTERLLNSMLPRQVADRLKVGLSVAPETFDSVSIFFSDIVGFTTIASQSEPLQIVAMLNKLYTLFDEIIESYEVYKVETIGDAYMVVSGLPERIDYHSVEIGLMALDFLDVVKGFVIDHLPDTQLKLRIGLHTGPCVTGVVGIAMPRYCLFGDTVNMASRMESTGEALKIQCSSAMNAELMKQNQGFITQKRGEIEVKGKGKQVTYWLLKRDGGGRRDSIHPNIGISSSAGNEHVDDVEPGDSISNAPRRGSDMSGYTDNNAYVLLDLPDITKGSNKVSSALGIPHKSDSIRTLGDVIVDRNSSTSSAKQDVHEKTASSASPSKDAGASDLDEIVNHQEPKTMPESSTSKREKPVRKSSFQNATTALKHHTDRIRKKSVGKVKPLQHSLAEMSTQNRQPSPDKCRFETVSENPTLAKDCKTGGSVFVKTGRPSSPDQKGPKRHSMGVIPDMYPISPVNRPDLGTQSPQSDGGIRSKSKRNGVVNVAFSTKVPDIMVRDYAESDEEASM